MAFPYDYDDIMSLISSQDMNEIADKMRLNVKFRRDMRLFSGVERLTIEHPTYEFDGVMPYTMRPFKWKLGDKKLGKLLSDFESRGMVNGNFSTMWTTLLVLKASMTDKEWKDNIYIRMLAFFLDSISEDDFKEYEPGKIRMNRLKDGIDLMSPVRIIMLMRAARISNMPVTDSTVKIDVVSMEGLVRYIFLDPYQNALKIKKKIGILNKYFFCSTITRDWMCLEHSEFNTDYQLFEISKPMYSDRPTYDAFKDKIEEALDGLNEMCPSLVEFIKKMIRDMPFNPENAGYVWYYTYCYAIVGYIWAPIESVIGEHKLGAFPEPKEYPKEFFEIGNSVGNDFISNMIEKEHVPSWRKFESMIFESLTTNSAGLGKVLLQFKDKGQDREISVTDKFSYFITHASDYFNKKIMEEGLTSAMPGKVGSRETPDRFRRLIFLIPSWLHSLMFIIGKEMYSYFEGRRTEYGFISTNSNQYGVATVDHFRLMYTTGRGEELIVPLDYSSFDRLVLPRVRDAFYDPVIEKLKGFADSNNRFGPFESVGQAVEFVVNKLKDTVYEIGGVKHQLIQEQSGEYVTLIQNTIFNYIVQTYVHFVLNKIGEHYHFKMAHEEYVGDDAYQTWVGIVPDYWTAEIIRKIMDDVIQICASVGFDISVVKTASRRLYTEYLKLIFCCGFYLPNGSRSDWISTERTDASLDVIDRMVSFRGYLSFQVGRGYDDKRQLAVMAAAFLYDGFINYKEFDKSGRNRWLKSWYPFSTLFVPINSGGVGCLTDTICGGANCDAIMYHYYKLMRKEFMIALINDTIAVVKDVNQNERKREISRNLMQNEEVSKGIEWLKNHLDSTTLRTSNEARLEMRKELLMRGESQDSVKKVMNRLFSYESWPHLKAVQNFSSLPGVRKYLVRDRSMLANRLNNNKIKYHRRANIRFWQEYNWIELLDIRLMNITCPFLTAESPVLCLPRKVQDLYKKFGVIKVAKDRILDETRIIRSLKRSLPNGITPEMVISQILSDPMITGDVRLISLSLQMMGASVADASNFAVRYAKSAQQLNIIESFSFFSINDEVGKFLCMSDQVFGRYFFINGDPGSMIYVISAFLCQLRYALYMSGVDRILHVDLPINFNQQIKIKYGGMTPNDFENTFLRLTNLTAKNRRLDGLE